LALCQAFSIFKQMLRLLFLMKFYSRVLLYKEKMKCSNAVVHSHRLLNNRHPACMALV